MKTHTTIAQNSNTAQSRGDRASTANSPAPPAIAAIAAKHCEYPVSGIAKTIPRPATIAQIETMIPIWLSLS